MVKKVTTTVATKRQIIGRKVLILGGSVIGGIIALAVAAAKDPETMEIVTIEETEEVIIEIPEKDENK